MKKIFSLFLCIVMVFALVACDGQDADPVNTDSSAATSEISGTDTDSDSSESSTNTVKEPQIVEDVIDNKFIAIDQIKERVVLYNFDNYEKGDTLDDLEQWSMSITHAAGLKYREDTVFGDVILIGGDTSGIYSFPGKKPLWITGKSGSNTHSVEILPSGNVVFANSTGNSVRLFSSCAALSGDDVKAQKYTDYELESAHGVLWDPEYEVLWALGHNELVAYNVVGEGVNEKLVLNPDLGTTFDEGSGHDLTPDYLDSECLYFTAGNVYHFNKETGSISKASSTMQLPEVKGFCHSPNDKFVSTGELGGAEKFFANSWKESWLTDTIIFYYKEAARGKVTIRKVELVSSQSAFYKVRFFCGSYQ